MEPLALHDIHRAQGALFGEVGGREVVRTYGRPHVEYQAARSAVALVDLSHRQLLRLTGEDRASFLHGMVTNDVKGLPEGAATYAALVTAKGAMVADARIWRRPADLLLEVEPGLAGRVKEFLEKYLVSEEVEISDASAGYGLLGLLGRDAAGLLGAELGVEVPALPLHGTRALAFEGHEVLAIGSDLLVSGSLELLVSREALAAVYRRLLEPSGTGQVVPMGLDALEVLRVEAGVPRFGQDMDERTIPLEAGLERAISYSKGCYIGQEVIARATFRGHVNRKLVGLLLGAEQPAPGAELRRGEKVVGWLTSVVASPVRGQNVALGYVHRDHMEPGTELELAGHPGRATVHALPLVPRG